MDPTLGHPAVEPGVVRVLAGIPRHVDVRWTGSTDDLLAPTAIEHEIWINGVINGVFVGTTRAIISTEVDGTNDTSIVAVDQAGNASARSNVVSEFTRIGGTCPA